MLYLSRCESGFYRILIFRCLLEFVLCRCLTNEFLLFFVTFGRFDDVSYILVSRRLFVLIYIGCGVAHEVYVPERTNL